MVQHLDIRSVGHCCQEDVTEVERCALAEAAKVIAAVMSRLVESLMARRMVVDVVKPNGQMRQGIARR